MASATERPAREFHLLLLAAVAAVTAIFSYRYAGMVASGQAVFAEDFAVFRHALDVMATWPPDLPYHAQDDAEYFSGAAAHYHPYLNAPFFLLLLWPLQALPYHESLAVFFGAQLALWCAVLAAPPVRRLWPALASRHYALTCAIISLPFLLNTVLAGQAGIFYAACLLLGASLLREKPAAAGMILALVLCKPTLAPLVAVLLTARGNIRALAAFIASGAAMAALSTAIWGMGVWPAWFSALALHARMMQLPGIPGPFATQLISLYSGARLLQAGTDAALALQCAATAGAVLAVIWAARRAQEGAALAVFFTSIFLAGGYALQYDAVILVAPILLLLDTGYRAALPQTTRIIMILCCFSGIVTPQLQALGIPFGPASVLLLWGQCLTLAKQAVNPTLNL